MVSGRLPKVFAMYTRQTNPTITPSEYKQTTELLSPLKMTKPQYERMHKIKITADQQQPLVNIIPATPLKLSDFVVISLLNTSFVGSVKKVLHAPTLRMFAVRVLAVSTRETRTSLADWLKIWSLMQEDCEQLIHIETTNWNQPEGHVSIALEYANSGSLQSLLDSLGAVPESILWSIAKQLAEALKFLHTKGIAHGQVTPSQVLLYRSGKVKLDVAAKPHSGVKTGQHSPYDSWGKRGEVTVEEDVFDLGTTLLECAMGGTEWMDCLGTEVEQTCCVYHSLVQAGVAPLLTRLSAGFQSFLCGCLRLNPGRRLRACDLATQEWMAQKTVEAGIKVCLNDLLSVSFQWVAPHEYQLAAEKQLDRICENLKMVLMRTHPHITSREPVSELALDLGLEESTVREKLAAIYSL